MRMKSFPMTPALIAPGRRRLLADVLVPRALAAMRAGRVVQALRICDRMSAIEPRCSWAYYFRAGLRLVSGDLVRAADDFRALETIAPEWLLVCRDMQTLSPTLYPQVESALDRLIAAQPRLPWARVFGAYYHRLREDWARSLAMLDAALTLAPETPAVLALASRLKYIYRLPKEGVATMEKAWRLAPGVPWINAWLGEVKRYVRQEKEALVLLERAIAADPLYNIAYSWRGSVRRILGFHREALSDINHALRTELFGDYSLAWAYHERSLLKRALGDYMGAFRDLNAAHAVNLRYVWGGDLYRKDRAELQSIDLLDRAIARHPRSAWALAWRGYTLGEARRFTEAAADLDRAVALDASLAWPRAWRARVCFESGRLEQARRDADAAVRLAPGYQFGRLLRGRLLRASGRLTEAERDLAEAVKRDPNCASAWAERGRVAFDRGRAGEAGLFLDRALRLDPNYADAARWREEARAAGSRPTAGSAR